MRTARMRTARTRTALPRVCLLPALALALAGCSALGLDDFDRCDELGETPAEQAAACAGALNALNDLPAFCVPWRCVDGQCVRNDEETCDAADNDCDGAIDEGVFAPRFVGQAERGGARPESLAISAGAGTVRAVWADVSEDARVVDLAPSVGNLQELDYVRNSESLADNTGDDMPGCWALNLGSTGLVGGALGGVERAETSCSFVDLATTPSAMGQSLFAAISDTGCARGQVRLGHLDSASPSKAFVFGPAGRSNAYLGVATEQGGTCSALDLDRCAAAEAALAAAPDCGGSCAGTEVCLGGTCQPTDCDADDDCGSGNVCRCGRCFDAPRLAVAESCGVADVNITGRPGSGSAAVEGLVTMVGGSAEQAHCAIADVAGTDRADGVRDVGVLGAFLQGTGNVRYVNATDEGRPEIVGETRASSAPGVTSLDDDYLMAWFDPEGALMLRVYGLEPPPASSPLACEEGLFGPDEDMQMCCTEPDCLQEPVCDRTQCGSDVGLCVSGRRTCSGGEGFCAGVVLPHAEVCGSGVDEDCDGLTDEADCADECPASAETCNAVDDDCDGMVDEGLGGEPCYDGPAGTEGEGVCTAGTMACLGGRMVCDGQILPPSGTAPRGETCGNGDDDDCDGEVDEADCDTCEPSGQETCNFLDDDCDGEVDETPVRESGFDGEPRTSRSIEVIRQCVATDPLAESLAFGLSEPTLESGSVAGEDVAIALGPRDAERLVVGITWRELREDGTQEIRFRTVTFAVDCECRDGGSCAVAGCDPIRTPTAIADRSAPVTLSDPGVLGAPSLVYVPEGFLAVGSTRGGGEVVDGGGWHVTWPRYLAEETEMNGRLRLRSVAAHDGLPIDASCTSECAREITRDPGTANVSLGATFTTETGPGFVYLDQDTVEVGALSCPPPSE